jgi:uncharacterized protein (DUF169 family)
MEGDTMQTSFIADEITAYLGLSTPPIGLAFVNGDPGEAPAFTGEVPSACTFWRRAESGPLFATAQQHFNCPVGAMVMGFDLPAPVQAELATLVGNMTACGYVAADEPPSIPAVRGKRTGIVYGPLKDLGRDPDVILVWLTPQGAMLWAEAAGACRWNASGDAGRVHGRPACAAIAAGVNSDVPALSFGCVGMRTCTEVSDGQLLGVLPGTRAEEFTKTLEKIAEVNRDMRSFYEGRKREHTGPAAASA